MFLLPEYEEFPCDGVSEGGDEVSHPHPGDDSRPGDVDQLIIPAYI